MLGMYTEAESAAEKGETPGVLAEKRKLVEEGIGLSDVH